MSRSFPYQYISCPCADTSNRSLASKKLSRDVEVDQEIDDEEETFDPRAPRSAFSLFPPEHLLYCEECREIKCPRCVTEEINVIYCPDCLFESPKVMVRGDGNRCPRNCFHCPVCTSQMITTSMGDSKEGPFILHCHYCMWSTLDIGVKFEKATGLRAQLDEMAHGARAKTPGVKVPGSATDDPVARSALSQPPLSRVEGVEPLKTDEAAAAALSLDANGRFHALQAFYKDQISESSATDASFPTSALDVAYPSPSSLQRIMNIYTNRENALKRARQKLTIMREARATREGFLLADPPPTPDLAYDETTSSAQRDFQLPAFIGTPNATQVSDLRPMPTLMRTKRSKRCAACKHILTRPELKISSARYRIKLIALNYIPFVTVKPLPIPGGLPPPGPDGADMMLDPGKPVQFVLTLRNPLFDDVSVSLGSPNVTPGRHGHRVTILCPEFQIGKNSDAWDDALNNPPGRATTNVAGGEQIAGRLYDQGRNWASVVIEVVPASIVRQQAQSLDEDDDVVEIPIRVRLEWKVTDEDMGTEKRKREKLLDEADDVDDGKRELGYWMVLGVGRVAC